MIIASYARYSSDKQREASIEDQCRNIERFAAREGWTITARFEDRAMSGTKRDRPGYKAMLAAAARREFDVLLVDELSRLDRVGETKQLIRRMKFRGMRVIGVSEGFDSAAKNWKLHATFVEMKNESDIEYLAERTHRGQTGQALKGFNAGGRSYGYRHVPVLDPIRLDDYGRPMIVAVRRAIDPDQATVVREIFNRFIAGQSARQIAHELNRRGIPGPRTIWRLSTIYGDKRTGVGILNNPLYNGDVIWNRSRWERDPDTDSRHRRERPQAEWIQRHDETLRIVTPEQWDAAQARMARREHKPGRKPRHLLSGLLRCSVCGGAYVKVDAYRYGCATHKDAGTCGNGMKLAVTVAERELLAGIKRDLLNDEALALFQRETTALLKAEKRGGNELPDKLAKVEQEIGNLVTAIKAGADVTAVRAALQAAEAQRQDLAAGIAAQDKLESLPDFLPRAADIFRGMVQDLEHTLRQDPDHARELLRELLGETIILTPNPAEKALDAAVPSQGVVRIALAMAVGSNTDNVVAGAWCGHQYTIISIPASGRIIGVIP